MNNTLYFKFKKEYFKKNDSNSRILTGICFTNRKDRERQTIIITPEEFLYALPKFEKKGSPVIAEHGSDVLFNNKIIGKVISFIIPETYKIGDRLKIKTIVEITDKKAIEYIDAKIFTGFSLQWVVGEKYYSKFDKEKMIHTGIEIVELSICRVPSNYDAYFEVIDSEEIENQILKNYKNIKLNKVLEKEGDVIYDIDTPFTKNLTIKEKDFDLYAKSIDLIVLENELREKAIAKIQNKEIDILNNSKLLEALELTVDNVNNDLTNNKIIASVQILEGSNADNSTLNIKTRIRLACSQNSFDILKTDWKQYSKYFLYIDPRFSQNSYQAYKYPIYSIKDNKMFLNRDLIIKAREQILRENDYEVADKNTLINKLNEFSKMINSDYPELQQLEHIYYDN
jgi:hypothetical protein